MSFSNRSYHIILAAIFVSYHIILAAIFVSYHIILAAIYWIRNIADTTEIFTC